MVRVRIAPSPTGIPHIGNTRTALFNYLFAKHNKGTFILRIEDTDQARLVPGSEDALYEILRWLGLLWDEDIVKQSERLDIYKKKADELIEKKFARKDEGAVRFIVPKEGPPIEWTDIVGNKHISFERKDIEDFIILKSDGFPTYHFANVIDDHDMQISDVIRGDEWISSTPKHILLYESFGWKHPNFAHLPVILGPDHQKLSKRNGAKSALDYRNEGYLPEVLLNYMVFLGWNPGGDQEIMTMDEMIKVFDLEHVNTASPIFDEKKLLWMNGVYIRKTQNSKLKTQILAQNAKLKDVNESLLDQLIPLAQTRMNTLNDFYSLTEHFFKEPEITLDQKEKIIANKLIEHFLTMKQCNNETILSVLKAIMQTENVRMSILYKIMTGKQSGLPLPESLVILGKEKSIERLTRLLQ